MTETAWNEPDRYPMELEFQSLSYEESGKTPILAQHGTKTFVIYGLNKQPVKGCSTHILAAIIALTTASSTLSTAAR